MLLLLMTSIVVWRWVIVMFGKWRMMMMIVVVTVVVSMIVVAMVIQVRFLSFFFPSLLINESPKKILVFVRSFSLVVCRSHLSQCF